MKYSLLLIFTLFALVTRAQNNCPQGYEERNVRCSGKIVIKCIPVNYTCKDCWTVEYAPCPGRSLGGGHSCSSYEKALYSAQKESDNWKDGKCSWFDNRKYIIYTDDVSFCTDDNKEKVEKDTPSNAKDGVQNIKGMHNSDAMGVRAENTIPKVESIAITVDKTEEQRQQQMAAERKQQDEARRQAAVNQQLKLQQDAEIQRQNAYNQRQQQLQSQLQAIQNQHQQNQQTIADIGSAVREGIEGIAAIYEQKRLREQAEQERRSLDAEMDRLNKEKEDADRKQREDAAVEVEQRRIQVENSKIELWQNKSSNILSGKIVEYAKNKKPSQIRDEGLKSIYYVIWNFSNLHNQILVSKPIEIKKSGDGDWPLTNDIYRKIETETKLVINKTPDNVTTRDNILGYLLGYFTDEDDALVAITNLQTNATNSGFEVKFVNANINEKKISIKDFWNEK